MSVSISISSSAALRLQLILVLKIAELLNGVKTSVQYLSLD